MDFIDGVFSGDFSDFASFMDVGWMVFIDVFMGF